jgi:DivIVA domain-containing protein
MAMSFSRPDPSSPASVREANFSTARRGFDQQEVRDFLRMVAAELERMQDRERYLDQELGSMRLRRPAPPAELDEETLARLLGEETTRILQAARESAAAMRSKSEAEAERVLREARDDAQHLREEAESDASRRRREAEQDAEAELEMAKQQGREMVEEARAYRERVLGELSRRRDLARQQIDQLIHGRDRLVQAFERARLVAADVVAELAPLGELSEYVNLSPTTGPVPVMVPASRLGEISSISDDVLAARARSDPDDPALDPNGATDAVDEPSDDTVDTADGTHQTVAAADDTAATAAEAAPDTQPPTTSGATVLQFPDRRVDTIVIAPGAEAEDDRDEVDEEVDEVEQVETAEEVDRVEAGEEVDEVDEVDEIDDDDITANDVDNLFARLRSQSESTTADAGPAEPGSDEVMQPTPFEVRDEALTPLIVSSGRKLKRVLADEQNDVLDRLRGKRKVGAIDDLVPPADAHVARYVEAIASDLRAAAAAGAAALAATEVSPDDEAALVEDVSAGLARDVIEPLRDRLGAGVADVERDNEAMAKKARSIYREWKTKRIDDHLDDLLREAYSRGAFAVLPDGEPVRWAFDPAVGACSECEDNSLQGTIPAGTAFPTGHRCAPAHPGCRCLILRA